MGVELSVVTIRLVRDVSAAVMKLPREQRPVLASTTRCCSMKTTEQFATSGGISTQQSEDRTTFSECFQGSQIPLQKSCFKSKLKRVSCAVCIICTWRCSSRMCLGLMKLSTTERETTLFQTQKTSIPRSKRTSVLLPTT